MSSHTSLGQEGESRTSLGQEGESHTSLTHPSHTSLGNPDTSGEKKGETNDSIGNHTHNSERESHKSHTSLGQEGESPHSLTSLDGELGELIANPLGRRKDNHKRRDSLVQNVQYKAHLADVLGRRLTPPPTPISQPPSTSHHTYIENPHLTSPATSPPWTKPHPKTSFKPHPSYDIVELEEVVRRVVSEEREGMTNLLEQVRDLVATIHNQTAPADAVLKSDRSCQTSPTVVSAQTSTSVVLPSTTVSVQTSPPPSPSISPPTPYVTPQTPPIKPPPGNERHVTDPLKTLEIPCVTQPGIIVTPAWKYWRVSAIVPLSPADGRVEKGDVIYQIGGKSVRGWSRGEVRAALGWYHSGRILKLTVAKCAGGK
eukprot:sb/3465831/